MEKITIRATVHAPLSAVWTYWTEPEHVTKWNAASDDWHSPRATNDLREGGTFNFRMEARDGSAGFDFAGTYTKVVPQQQISYKLGDDRAIDVLFEQEGDAVNITETFDPETENSIEMQRNGWQSILDRFKAYAEQK